MGDFLKVSTDGALATLTFERGKGLNILSRAVLDELGEAWADLEKNGTARVGILRGAGKVFLAGADIKEMAALDPPGAVRFAAHGQRVFQAIEDSRIVSIAALHGAALGGGCELALACDIRIAAEGLKIGQPEVNLGLIPGFGGSQRLPRVVGLGHALDLILSGAPIGAARALEIGLVTKSVPAEALLDEAKKMAATLLAKGPGALRAAKRLVRQALSTPLQEGLAAERELFAKTFTSGEAQEGLRAFLEKRAPNFK